MTNIQKFGELLCSDESLQDQLEAEARAYKGDKDDERAFFDAVVAPLADGAGLPFTYDEWTSAASEGIQLDRNQLDDFAAGSSQCFVIGVGIGSDACMSESEFGANACAGIGAGFYEA